MLVGLTWVTDRRDISPAWRGVTAVTLCEPGGANANRQVVAIAIAIALIV
jgi:hypothetical protein